LGLLEIILLRMLGAIGTSHAREKERETSKLQLTYLNILMHQTHRNNKLFIN